MKKVLVASIVMVGLLSGCQSDTAQDKKITALEQKVEQLSSDFASAKMNTMNAQAEAERANKRIDNIATSYKK